MMGEGRGWGVGKSPIISSSSAAFVLSMARFEFALCSASACALAARRAFDCFAIWMRAMPAGSCVGNGQPTTSM